MVRGQVDDGGILAHLAVGDQLLQAVFRPARRGLIQVGEQAVAEGAFLGNVVQQFLVVELPAGFLGDATSNGAAPRPGFAAQGHGQARRVQSGSGRLAAVSLEAVQGRFAARRLQILGIGSEFRGRHERIPVLNRKRCKRRKRRG